MKIIFGVLAFILFVAAIVCAANLFSIQNELEKRNIKFSYLFPFWTYLPEYKRLMDVEEDKQLKSEMKRVYRWVINSLLVIIPIGIILLFLSKKVL